MTFPMCSPFPWPGSVYRYSKAVRVSLRIHSSASSTRGFGDPFPPAPRCTDGNPAPIPSHFPRKNGTFISVKCPYPWILRPSQDSSSSLTKPSICYPLPVPLRGTSFPLRFLALAGHALRKLTNSEGFLFNGLPEA